MSVIQVENLTFSYDGSPDVLFENVNFRIDADWRLGFCGRNGRGKTTFLKLLRGEYTYSGRISASVTFDYFPFAVPDETLTPAELLRQICPGAARWELERELSLLLTDDGLPDRPFASLSGGERTKALLALLFLRENRFLLIDEPTNHLDRDGREALARYLRGKKGFILVSHDRAVLDGCVDHILSVNRTNIEIEQGNYSSWEENKAARDKCESVRNTRLKNEIRRLSASARRAAEHSAKIERTKIGFDPTKVEKTNGRRPSIAKKAEKLMNRSKALEARIAADIEEKSGLLKNIEETEALKLPVLPFHSAVVLRVRDVSIRYGERTVCSGVSFDLREGEILSLAGKNGCGKTSLLRLIAGEDVPHTGEVLRNPQLRVSFVAQDARGLKGDLSSYAAQRGYDESLFKAILRKLDFSREQFEKDISAFSDGQKKKVLIASSLCTPAHLYIWDEPLNYLDVYTRRQLEELLHANRVTMLLVEHDAAFCRAVQTGEVRLG